MSDDNTIVCSACGQSYGIGDWPFCKGGHGRYRGAVINDELEGGPRRFETMGDDAPYIATKSQWKREVQARGLEHVDRHDRAYHDRWFRQRNEYYKDTGQTA